jgi:hypothetical protein
MANDEPSESRRASRLGFLEKLRHVLHGSDPDDEAPATDDEAPSEALAALEHDFESALDQLKERVESMRASQPGAAGGRGRGSAIDAAAARKARLAEIHDHIRADIEAMHARLGSGIDKGELDRILDGLAEVDELSRTGRDSHNFLPRAQHAIAERLRKESGELAIARLRMLLERDQQTWPDPIRYDPHATEEEIERSRRRRLGETREAFLAHNFARIAERAVGNVTGWASDYPEPGSPLWQECVLEGVGAGIRGELCLAFLEVLRTNIDAVVADVEDGIGKQIAELRRQLEAGIRSVDDGQRVLLSTLAAVDVITPDVAWRQIIERLPLARGEWDDQGERRPDGPKEDA